LTNAEYPEDEDRLKADVVVVGAGIAGSTAAILFGRMGLDVVVLDAEPDINAHKRICAHYIQPSALPVLRRTGLDAIIEDAGGIVSTTDVWLRTGWIRSHLPSDEHGYNIRRSVLDPLLRQTAAWTPGVRLRQGHEVRDVFDRAGRVAGVIAQDPRTGHPLLIEARLVVAADGRRSPTAKLAGVPSSLLPNGRFAYLAYYRNPRSGPEATRQRVWYLGSNVAFESPTDGGLTCFSVHALKDELAVWRIDSRTALRRMFASVPDGVDLADVKREGPVSGVLEMPNVRRMAALPGLALVGDAALAADPLFRTGCAWAFQSASWLVSTVGPSLRDGTTAAVDSSLRAYAEIHGQELLPHYEAIANLSTGRPLRFGERLLTSAAARDGELARLFDLVAARSILPSRLSRPRVVLRAMGARLRRSRPEAARAGR
jgi:2-polyprenyl-6-methoxyphenol hydroxylase-like FAD-dependent oxidoreductase